MNLCTIIGHRWTTFYAEQCPLKYEACKRCSAVRHACNKIGGAAQQPSTQQHSGAHVKGSTP